MKTTLISKLYCDDIHVCVCSRKFERVRFQTTIFFMPLLVFQRSYHHRSSRPSSIRSDREPLKVILRGRGLKEAEVDKPAVFHVDGTQATPGKSFISTYKSWTLLLMIVDMMTDCFSVTWSNNVFIFLLSGTPHSRLDGVRTQIPVTTSPEGPQLYKCTYVPKVRSTSVSMHWKYSWQITPLLG